MSNDGGFRQTWLEMFFLWGKWSSKKLQLWEIAQESARLQPLAPIRDDYLRGKQHPTMGQRFRSAISHDITRIISPDRTYAGFYVVFFKDVICPVCPSRWQSFFNILQFGLKKHRKQYGCDTDMWQNLRPNVVTWTIFFWGGVHFHQEPKLFLCLCEGCEGCACSIPILKGSLAGWPSGRSILFGLTLWPILWKNPTLIDSKLHLLVMFCAIVLIRNVPSPLFLFFCQAAYMSTRLCHHSEKGYHFHVAWY